MKLPKNAFASTLIELAMDDPRIVVIDADVSSTTKSNKFKDFFPDRFINVGIAEQNLVGIAAGLAKMGFIPFVTSLAAFISRRALDQIVCSVCLPNLNVKIIGMSTGLSSARDGASHQSLEDIAIMRALPNMSVVVPGTELEIRESLKTALKNDGPFYIGIQRNLNKGLDEHQFHFGKGILCREGSDLTIVTTGRMIASALNIAQKLEKYVSLNIVHMPTIKPIDKEILMESAHKTYGIITLEEHNVLGGLGSAVSEVISQYSPTFVERIGIEDKFGTSALEHEHLLVHYGLDENNLCNRIMEIKNKLIKE